MKKIKTIALVAPSGVLRNLDEINQKIAILEKHFKVKKFYDENASCGFLADSDENRAKYFESAFQDDEVDLVLSIRGGYGAIRIVDKINYSLIKDKFYAGSSDATILLCALNKKTNVKTFHSLMITNGFVENLERNIEIIENDIFNLNSDRVFAREILDKYPTKGEFMQEFMAQNGFSEAIFVDDNNNNLKTCDKYSNIKQILALWGNSQPNLDGYNQQSAIEEIKKFYE
jgi:muramoyltetrapeptide carboxypeptidase